MEMYGNFICKGGIRLLDSLNLSQLGFDKYTQNVQLSRVINNRNNNKKDRLASSRFKGKINLLHDSLSFLLAYNENEIF